MVWQCMAAHTCTSLCIASVHQTAWAYRLLTHADEHKAMSYPLSYIARVGWSPVECYMSYTHMHTHARTHAHTHTHRGDFAELIIHTCIMYTDGKHQACPNSGATRRSTQRRQCTCVNQHRTPHSLGTVLYRVFSGEHVTCTCKWIPERMGAVAKI